MNIYIACGLTHVPRSFFKKYTSFIHMLAETLSQQHIVKYALVDSDPQLSLKPDTSKSKLCYLWDRKMVEESDIIIAESSFPSTGMGIELQLAENNDIPIIICYRDFEINKSNPVSYVNPDKSNHNLQIGDGFISHMVLGLPNVVNAIQYDSDLEGINSIIDALSLFEK